MTSELKTFRVRPAKIEIFEYSPSGGDESAIQPGLHQIIAASHGDRIGYVNKFVISRRDTAIHREPTFSTEKIHSQQGGNAAT